MFDFLELAIPGTILIGIIYGIIRLAKFCYRSIKERILGTPDGKLTYEQKKNLLNVIKLLGGAQLIGLVFYITPTINENLKILVSILIVLGGFIGAFFVNEKRSLTRTLVFLGQEFFGITMILLMVNKGIGYSVTNIFAIWSVFNLYICMNFKNIENKLFFVTTVLIFIISLLNNYANNIEMYMAIIGLIIVLLMIEIFGVKENKLIQLLHNFILTIFGITVLVAVGDEVDKQAVIFGAVVIYSIALVILQIIRGNLNLKAFLVYIPYVVVLFLSDFILELFLVLTVFNMLFSLWLISGESLYRKYLCLGLAFLPSAFITEYIVIDEFFGFFIYILSLISIFPYLFTPIKPDTLDEGGDLDEE